MERPKRNMPKKWDPDFLSPLHARDGSRTDKRLSLNPSDIGDKGTSPPKRAYRRRVSAAPGEVSDLHPVDGGAVLVDENGQKTRSCMRGTCTVLGGKPFCFVQASNFCSRDGYTSRWHHISLGEHYCNECFDNFYRSLKAGYVEFCEWKRKWSSNGMTEANVRTFLADRRLPFWLQCNICSKWRQLSNDTDVTVELVRNFKCADAKNKQEASASADTEKIMEVSNCEEAEDIRVELVKQPGWIAEQLVSPYLISSPAAPFLVNFYPDGVTMSASTTTRASKLSSPKSGKTCNTVEAMTAPVVAGVPSYCQPFAQPDQPTHAQALPADHMTGDEIHTFSQYAKEQHVYLAVRNLAVALWVMNPKEMLTIRKCVEHLICRGLVRIRCVLEIPHVLCYLTHMQYINVGIYSGSITELEPLGTFQKSVLVIGAGAAGLAAARHLHNMGCQVTVLEARDRIGGRVYDDLGQGMCVARGAQIINACNNDPFALLTYQTGGEIYEMTDKCVVFDRDGTIVDSGDSRRMEFHFNMLLDNLWEQKKLSKMTAGVSLEKKINEMHLQFIDETQFPFTEEEASLLQFHMSYMEQACGASLDQISSNDWDQNESFSQFSGSACFLPQGYTPLLNKLASNIDIRFNNQVVSIDYSSDNDRVEIVTFGETHIFADYVVVTVPLTILRKGVIAFNPPLPESKRTAIERLGVGLCEKVAVKFPHCFWREKTGRMDAFGRIPQDADDRGLFTIFYDMSASYSSVEMDKSPGILVSYLTGKSAKLVKEKSDKDIINIFVEKLKKLFPEETVDEPLWSMVTRWQDDSYSAMSYSYMALDSRAEDYDQLALPLDDKIFFAGEATNRAHPQTICGAYLSGMREARRILSLQKQNTV